jgi:ABC-type transport system involved in cytochrome bd biosynthesis fused ATPase/permease subunit
MTTTDDTVLHGLALLAVLAIPAVAAFIALTAGAALKDNTLRSMLALIIGAIIGLGVLAPAATHVREAVTPSPAEQTRASMHTSWEAATQDERDALCDAYLAQEARTVRMLTTGLEARDGIEADPNTIAIYLDDKCIP